MLAAAPDRCFTAQAQEEIPIFGNYGLVRQLGCIEYTRPRRFVAILKQWLEIIRTVGPDCPAGISIDGTRFQIAFLARVPLGLRDAQHNQARSSDMAIEHIEKREGVCYVTGTRVSLDSIVYALLMCIEKTLLDQGVHTSWATVRETLKTHQTNTIVLPTDKGTELRIRKVSTPEAAHREIYQKLGIGSEIIPTRKAWTTVESKSK